MMELAAQRGGRCLSEFVDMITPMKWECKEGHTWIVRPHSIVYQGNWCRQCAVIKRTNIKRLDIERVRQKALSSGYEVLDMKNYKSVETAIELRHLICGTRIKRSLHAITSNRGNPCPVCNGRSHLNETDARKYALEHKGALIAWGGKASTHSTWKCEKGHIWHGSWRRLAAEGSWCQKCRVPFFVKPNKHKRFDELTRLAKKSLSGYKRADEKKQMKFDLTLDDVKQAKKSKCQYCGREASGLDRIDNNLGHTKANCVPSCLRCNWVRGSFLSYEVMLQVGKLLREIDP